MNTNIIEAEPFNGKFSEEMMRMINEHIPQAHAESLQLFIKQNKQLKLDYVSLEDRIKVLREDHVKLHNTNEKAQEELKEFMKREADITLKEAELQKRDAEISKREMLRNQTEEIAALKLENEKSRVGLMTATMDTIFRPAALRKELQKTIPIVRGDFSSYYDNDKCVNVPVQTGDHIEHDTENITEIKHDE